MELRNRGRKIDTSARKPDRIGSVIAAVGSVGTLLFAHLAAPNVSLWLLVIPAIAIGTGLAVALRRGRGRRR